ncbi:hypothetical protein H5T88_04250 [bacterium]|nr:hypothetical protein [bacterium]
MAISSCPPFYHFFATAPKDKKLNPRYDNETPLLQRLLESHENIFSLYEELPLS